jgi:hypothetical protein
METIIASCVTGVITLIGVIIANGKTQAVMEERVGELTREVRKHNDFAEKIPVIQEQIKFLNNTVEELKEYHK